MISTCLRHCRFYLVIDHSFVSVSRFRGFDAGAARRYECDWPGPPRGYIATSGCCTTDIINGQCPSFRLIFTLYLTCSFSRASSSFHTRSISISIMPGNNSRQPTWEDVKEVAIRYYQNHSITALMQFMETNYGFVRRYCTIHLGCEHLCTLLTY
jgi:hypothetical protein